VCFQLAVSNETGHSSIKYADISKENQGMASLVDNEPTVLNLCAEVETVSLDDFAARHGIGRIDVIKCDIQGAEPYMLEGGKHVFTHMSPDIVMEVSPKCLRGAGKTTTDLLRLVKDYRYQVLAIGRGGKLSDVRLPFKGDVFCTKRATGSHPSLRSRMKRVTNQDHERKTRFQQL
jgi:hypothetical protein